MTDEELAAIDARLQAATPEPWTMTEEEGDWYLRAPDGESMMCDTQYYPWTPGRAEDWQLIAHAPTDLAALMAEVRRLRAAIQRFYETRGRHEGAHVFDSGVACSLCDRAYISAEAELDATR